MKNCIAAVDMGTNSFHLIIVQVRQDGSFKIIDREREVIRLGFHKGEGLTTISEGEIEKAIDVAEIAQQFGGGGHKNASGFASDISDIDIFPKS